MDSGGDHESLLVKLTRMEGKLDLSNLRHAQNDEWKITVDQRLHRLGNDHMVVRAEVKGLTDLPPRVDSLERSRDASDGERRGITNTLKVAWLLGGGGATAIVMAVARKAGLL